ncbi:hypothetical protein [Microbulbifer marinus]|uniref:Uncharacterized protein n=1 Tax=Microbulbifer marinus TaxID=658218 RepID=A0A1H4AL63_9GAMM|nr:hypothetical protein [Microbulbifer marinus]SEA36660.1 hypothetical protein SAMN05216562_2859 [Microbulbifer marinus]
MSLTALNKRIQSCSRDMDRQRLCAQQLLHQQKNTIGQQVPTIPLPAAMGLAFIGGLVAERFFNSPAPSNLFRIYLALRAF